MNKKIIIIVSLIVSVIVAIRLLLPIFFVKTAPDSLVQLIATPNKFQNQQVRVSGYLVIEFEGNALYLHEDDALNGITANSVWVVLTDEMRTNPEKYSHRYVSIEGVFIRSYGHMYLFSGTLKDISNCYLLNNEANQQLEPTSPTPVESGKD